MRRHSIFGTLLAALTLTVVAPLYAGEMESDPTLFAVFADQLEWRNAGNDDLLAWDAQGWIGKDLNKFWWKTDGEMKGGDVDDAELQFLYSHSIAPYWEAQVGVRTDIKPDPGRDWAVIGIQGLAPYFFELDTSLFIGSSGRTAARVDAEYSFLFTQKLILTPEIEINAYGENDPAMRIGSGLSNIELGLRLRYEIRREFAPYIGVNWGKKFGTTADFAREDGLDTSDTQLVVGIRAWF